MGQVSKISTTPPPIIWYWYNMYSNISNSIITIMECETTGKGTKENKKIQKQMVMFNRN